MEDREKKGEKRGKKRWWRGGSDVAEQKEKSEHKEEEAAEWESEHRHRRSVEEGSDNEEKPSGIRAEGDAYSRDVFPFGMFECTLATFPVLSYLM